LSVSRSRQRLDCVRFSAALEFNLPEILQPVRTLDAFPSTIPGCQLQSSAYR
jgi:hypothetical protein